MGILQYDRKKFFEGVGTEIGADQQHSLDEVIKLSGLDYVVEKQRIYDQDGDEIPGSYCTMYRDNDGSKHFLGSGLKEQYTVLQNSEAFDFLSDLLGDVKVECAGATHGGNRAFICASTEPIKILDDDVTPYINFINSHDGGSSIMAMLTPVRMFCSNCLALSIKQAVNKITIKHSRNVQQRLYIAKDVLLQNTKYLEAVKTQMEELATMRFTRKQFIDNLTVKVLQFIGLYDEDGQPIEKKRNAGLAESYRDHMLACWSANDLANYDNTGYKAIQALLDFESHRTFARNNENPETRFKSVLAGMLISDFALQYIKATAIK